MKNNCFRKFIYQTFVLGLLCFVVSSENAAAQSKKYGLFVGINSYTGGINPLNGCVNDAKNLQRTLAEKYGFAAADTTLLTDAQATRDGILNSIKAYQAKAQAGDVFVFTYSGHGTLFPDAKSEEQDEESSLEMADYYPLDKYDSAICPYDLRSSTSGKPWNNLILDDELYALFSGFTAKGSMVIFLSDSCHSGTLARSLGDNSFDSKLQPRARFLPLNKVRTLNSIPAPARTRRIKRTRNDVGGLLIVLSGSKDNEFSLDYPDSSGAANGLFTKTLLETISRLASEGKKASYATVRDVVAPEVSRLSAMKENRQNPQIDNRFFAGSLDTPLFEFAGKTSPSPQPNPISTDGVLRVVVKVTDKQGMPVDGAAVGIFNQSVGRSLTAGDVSKISPRDIRAAARTDKKGIYDSNIQSLLIPQGTYFIKVVRDGYAPYIGEVKIEENAPGFCVLVVNLDKL